MRLPAGQRLGAFEILGLLGVGGMGEVYRARDSRLHREVAIKVLPQSVAADAGRLARFEREARTLAALDHPNIAPVFDFQEAEGSHFLVMQLIEGPTLADRLKRGPLPVDEALGLFVEIADGMAAAHDQGIIHRDLKPANLKIDNRGRARILDFGLAKAFEAAEGDRDSTGTLAMSEDSAGRTGEGQVLGTPAYMSPEQARGQAVDRRADVWAFGICLFEALSGRRPFHGETASDLLADILRGEPDWSALPRGLPSHLQSLIRRCLEKNPRRRYSSLADIAITLDEAASDWKKFVRGEAETVLPSTPSPTPRFPEPAAPSPFLPQTPTPPANTPSAHTPFAPPTPTPSSEIARLINRIVVLPFDNLMGDPNQEHFVDGMTESLSIELSKMTGVEVISHNSAMHYKRTTKLPKQIARELGIEGLLCGAIMRAGDDIRITVRIIDGKSDRQVWADQYDGKHAQILSLQKQAALAVAEQISTTLTLEDRMKTINVPDVNPEAHNEFLLGRHFTALQTGESLTRALAHYEKAIALDPGYAAPHAGLAEVYVLSGSYGTMRASRAFSLARTHAIKATQLDGSLGIGYAVHAHALIFLEQDWPEAERLLDRALLLNPRDAGIYEEKAHLCALLGRFDEAHRLSEAACELDPLNANVWSGRGRNCLMGRKYENALVYIERSLALQPDLIHSLNAKTYCMIAARRFEDAVRAAERAAQIYPKDLSTMANVSLAHAFAGRKDDAMRGLSRLKYARSTKAMILAALGDHESALHELESSLEEVDWPILIAGVAPFWDPLRRHPRFRGVLTKLRLPDDIDRDFLPENSGTASSGSSGPTLSDDAPRSSSPAVSDRLVVLPFDNLMGDPNQEHFVDGMTEALSIELSRMPGVEVISHTSAMRFKGTKTPHAEIASQLGAATLVAGSIMRAGEEIRITVRLIDGGTERQTWGNRYEGKHAMILSLQGEVALAVAGQVSSNLTHRDREKAANAPVVNPEAHEAWLLARHFARRRTSSDLRRALEYYERANRIDPAYAPAYTGISEIYLLMDFFGMDLARKPLRLSQDAALRALELDPRSADACRALASSRLFLDRDGEEADRLYRKAIELAPDDAEAYRSRGNGLSMFGRFAEARKSLEKACRLDPLNPAHWMFRSIAEYRARDFEASLKWCDHALMLEPNNSNALNQRAFTLLALERFDEANRMADTLRDSGARDGYLLRTSAHVYAFTGRKDEARGILARLIAEEGQLHQPKSALSLIYLGLGETNTALDLLDRSVADLDAFAMTCGYGPSWDAVRTNPRFRSVRRKLGFLNDDDLELMPPESKPASSPSAFRTGDASPSSGSGIRRIEKLAVLPFTSIAKDDSDDWFVDGVTEALITELGKIRSLSVISRSSAMQFKRTTKSAPTIALELGVDGLVEGSVQRVGDDVRIQARLVDPRTDRQLWANDYDGKMRGILKLQKEVALTIAREVRATISPSEARRIAAASNVNPEAYELYLRGLHFYHKLDEENLRRSQSLLEKAIELDPDFCQAHAFLAMAHTAHGLMYSGMAASRDRVKQAVDRALQLDPNDAMAHTVAGWFALTFEWDWPTALRELQRAIELNPGLADAHNALAWYYNSLGRFQEAVEAEKVAIRLDPLNASWRVWLAMIYRFMGRAAEALIEGREVLELDPDHLLARVGEADSLRILGRSGEALQSLDRATRRHGSIPMVENLRVLVLLDLNRRAEAEAVAADLLSLHAAETVPAFIRGWVLVAMGRVEEGFPLLIDSLDQRGLSSMQLYGPAFERFWGDPRLHAALDRLGFPGERPRPVGSIPPSSPANPAASSPGASAAGEDSNSPRIRKIAVLPFTSIAKDASEDWLTDGMTELLITELGKIKSLTVISRTSAMRYKRSEKPLTEIAIELNVDALVEGSVIRMGNDVQITARLIDGRSDQRLWGDFFSGKFEEIPKLQGEVTLSIAREVKATVSPEEAARVENAPRVVSAAYESFLRARVLAADQNTKGFERAASLLEHAIRIDPGFAEAYAELANLLSDQMGWCLKSVSEVRERCMNAAQRAMALAPGSSFAHHALGSAMRHSTWKQIDLERDFKRAIELDPGNILAHVKMIWFLAPCGRFEEARAHGKKALELDPFSGLAWWSAGMTAVFAREFDEAIQIFRKGLEVDPDYVAMQSWLGVSLMMKGETGAALPLIRRGVEMTEPDPSPHLLTNLGFVLHRSGDEAGARSILDRLISQHEAGAGSRSHIAMLLGELGEPDEAMEWLTADFEAGEWVASWLKTYALYDPLRADPRFHALVRQFELSV